MKKFRVNIDGKEVTALPGQTILEVAKENGVHIPTLCFDDRTEIYGACGICVVEAEGNPKLLKACATEIAPNMIIHTDTERVYESRKTNLELLLSNHVGDCRPPCMTACPAHTDCQGYVGLVANGNYEEAIRLIRTKIPLPGAIGRVCPHPCEDNCRRRFVEEPISIAGIKRFAADFDYADGNPYIPETGEETGKTVAVIGGGPFGLSLANFLRILGHSVTIFEAMPKAGGMLRYGIPEYRLPNAALDEEIAIIEAMGVEIRTNTRIGKDTGFDTLQSDYDAVAVGIGAWVSTGTGAKGEDLDGVLGGIDFLRRVVRGEELSLGNRIAIVGGGNTAMDVCRTAVRLGADKVYNIYRRTKDEMPADRIEIEEAEEEGVIFKNLTNPIEIIKGKDGKVSKIKLQVMELGDPDASGRRAPIPVKGKTETIDVDNVILATGQAVDPIGFDVLEKTRKKGISYDPETFMTSIPGVFAGGDCGNDKISIAIEAMADAKKASDVIDAYLNGEEVGYAPPYIVERTDIDEKTFEDRERQCREAMPQLTAQDRKDNFIETVFGYDAETATTESERCLECGCGDYFECKLYAYANEYDVSPSRLDGAFSLADELTGKPIDPETYDDGHPFIVRDSNKCILCGLCVRVCDEIMGIGALGLVDRGFDTIVKPTLEKPLAASGCTSCGQCVSVCPTGALQERLSLPKSVPLDTVDTDTTCPYCSVGCSISLKTYGEMLVKADPKTDGAVNRGLLCGKGKFGFDCAELEGKLLDPLLRTADGKRLAEADYYDAFVTTARKAQAVASRYGSDAVAVAISDRYTNEEIYAIRALAEELGARTVSLNARENGLAKVLGIDASPNTIDELLSSEVILAVGFNTADNPVIYLKLKQAAEAGAKVVLINPRDLKQQRFAFAKTVYTSNNVKFLKEIAKQLIDADNALPAVKSAEGYAALIADLADVKVSPAAAEIAALYAGAKKAMVVYQQNALTKDAAALVGNIAVLSGHIGKPRDGVLLLKPKNNSQGLQDQGVRGTALDLDGVKALLIFGEDPLGAAAADGNASPEIKAAVKAVKDAEFVMVCDTHLTKTAEKADVVIPGTGFASTDGTFTNTERRLQLVQEAAIEDVEYTNWEIAKGIAAVLEAEFPWEDTDDISTEMEDNVPVYRYASVGEVFGGVLTPANVRLAVVGDGKLVDKLASTDSLMNAIEGRLPKPEALPADR
ncbi:MAG: FAD-dependent oxidoreductase [Clostridiales Family XIII bacterium]|jgi:formate dehydrogenase major subunit|nr:FAD-dependent oxidoreductase [Clostridiales Family XIII bacterium]